MSTRCRIMQHKTCHISLVSPLVLSQKTSILIKIHFHLTLLKMWNFATINSLMETNNYNNFVKPIFVYINQKQQMVYKIYKLNLEKRTIKG